MSKIVENYKVEGSEWSNALDKAFNKINKKVKIDGFRQGKAPRNIYEKKYGKTDLYVEASDELVHQYYHKLIDEKNIIPVAEPQVNLVKLDDNGMEVNFTFFVKPEVTLGKYKNLGIKKEKATATKKEVETRINSMREKFADLVDIDTEVKKGNIAVIDFEGFKDGVAFSGGKGENYSLEIGSNTFIPGFEDGIIGMKKGEEKDLALTFPKDYAADLAGAKVTFHVKVNEIKQRVLPELNEEFLKDLNIPNVDTVEKLNKQIEEEILAEKNREIDNKFLDEVLKKATDEMTAEIEDEIYEEEVNRMYHEFVERMKMQGIDEELYFKYTNTKKEDLRKNMKEEATFRVRSRYLLESIAKAENISPTEEEALKEAESLAEKYQMTKEEIIKSFGGIEVLVFDLQMRKTLEFLKENN